MDELKKVLVSHVARYPAMTPQDAVKLIYQNEFGSYHLICDEKGTLARLTAEYRGLVHKPKAALREEIGNGLCRVQLTALDTNDIPLDTLNRLVLLGSELIRGDTQLFRRKLEVLRGMTEEGKAPFSLPELDAYLDRYLADGCPAATHSERYREAYQPAYRLVLCRYVDYWPLFSAIHRLLREKNMVSVAIDGMAAAGKTTLAALLQELYSCAVVRMDHFFLPGQLRTPERLAQPGGNVHYERFAAEVAPRLGRGASFSYKPFDCRTMKYRAAVSVPQRRMTVVEGAYSLHPMLKVSYDLKVYLTVSEQEQSARILLRNGPEVSRRFWEEWIPMEHAYSRAFCIPQSCDFVF